MWYVLLYLLAIVLANVTVALFGPWVSVLNAFLFIGFNLTARDKLHDAWHGNHLKRNMALLILAGSVLSFALGAGQIAIASLVAFALSETVDSVGYHLLRGQGRMTRMNGSNIPAAAVDSIVFPYIAFGSPLLWPIVIGQFVAKVFGGAIWSAIICRVDKEV